MKRYFLSGEDLDKINKILQNAKSTNIIYDRLYQLELQNKKETDEYKKQMEFLKISVDLEKKIYTKYNFSSEKKSVLIRYLVQYKYHKPCLDDMGCVVEQDYKSMEVVRVVRKLISDLSKTKVGFKEIYADDSEEMTEKELKHAMNTVKILREVNKDIYNSYLLFLQAFINDEQYNNYKCEFTKSKYNLSFIDEDIEKEMLKNNFNVNEDLYLGSKLTSDILRVETDEYNYIKEEYSEGVLCDLIKEILENNDLDYNDRKTTIATILKTCFVRAYLLMLSEEKLCGISMDFNEFVDSEEYLEKHINDTISEKLIKDCFKCTNQDKTKVKTLSFSLK